MKEIEHETENAESSGKKMNVNYFPILFAVLYLISWSHILEQYFDLVFLPAFTFDSFIGKLVWKI